ncbi:hypothetical protein [Pseudophaeobacter sp. TrK17]|uniref:hypothetical protein n=1 Tax=Pseudophaeobacter sp. TrK17 TaxID=2815167 RepID=UPI0035D08EF9
MTKTHWHQFSAVDRISPEHGGQFTRAALPSDRGMIERFFGTSQIAWCTRMPDTLPPSRLQSTLV